MKRRILTTMLLLVSGLTCYGQDNPLEMVKQYPPELLRETDIAMKQMEWKFKQIELANQQKRAQFEALKQTMAALEQSSTNVQNSLPPEIRFITPEVRSSLLGNALKELFDTRLELAVKRTILEQLEAKADGNRRNQDQVLEIQTQEIAMEVAAKRAQLAKSEYDNVINLTKKGSKTTQEASRAKYSYEVARLELKAASVRLEQARNNTNDSDIAQQLTDARLEIKPLEARLKAVNEFINLLNESSRQLGEVRKLSGDIESHRKLAEALRRDLLLLEYEQNNLTSLRAMTQKRNEQNKKRAEKEDDAPQDESPFEKDQ